MDIATYIANYQTTPDSAELGTAQLQLVICIVTTPTQLQPQTTLHCLNPVGFDTNYGLHII